MKRHAEYIKRPGSLRRLLLVGLGSVCVGLGAIGIAVPGMPTTVFLLAAAWLYARSCPGLHRRLVEHPRFGPYLRMAEQRQMPLSAKIASLTMMWTGIALGCALVGDPIARAIAIGLGLVGSGVVLFWVRTRETVSLG